MWMMAFKGHKSNKPSDKLARGGVLHVALWILGVYKRYRITGKSMLPLLEPHDEVFVRCQSSYCVGDIVVAKLKYDGERVVVKRITMITADSCFLMGDNLAESTDSRVWGEISLDHIIGRVSCKFI